MSAVVFSRAITGDGAVFQPPMFVLRSYWELLPYAMMGVLLGALAAGYIRFFNATAAAFRKLKVPQWARLALGLLIVGLVAIPLPQNLSDGYPVINHAMEGRFEIGMTLALTGGQVLQLQRVARLRCAGRRFRPDLFHRHDGGGDVSARDGFAYCHR